MGMSASKPNVVHLTGASAPNTIPLGLRNNKLAEPKTPNVPLIFEELAPII